MVRTLVCGDIHGRFKALRQVLKLSKFNYDKDRLIVLGDAVDGGINTYKCVEELLKIKDLIYIIGNHDEFFMKYINSGWAEEIWLQQGGCNTLNSYGAKTKEGQHWDDKSEVDTTNLKIPKTHKDFFNRGIYWYEQDNMMFVHGGFRPKLHPKNETKFNLIWDRDIINTARLYQKTGKKIGKWDMIFIGHTTTQMFANDHRIKDCYAPQQFANLMMCDTGAGWWGRLTVMDIHSKEFWVSDMQEPAR